MAIRRSRKLTLTIAADATASGAVWVADVHVRAIEMPASITGDNPTVALQNAAIGDQSGTNTAPSTFFAMVDGNGVPVTFRVQTGKHLVLTETERDAFEAGHWVRLVASASQAAARTFYLIGTQGD